MTRYNALLILLMSLMCSILQSVTADVFDLRGKFVTKINVSTRYELPMHSYLPSSIDISSLCTDLAKGIYIIAESHGSEPGSSVCRPNPLFTDATEALLPMNEYSTGRTLVADFDGDGWEDVFFTITDIHNDPVNQPRLYIHQPDGTYQDETSSRMPELNKGGHEASLLDFENDGDTDILYICESFDETFTNYLFLNDGTGHFSLASQTVLPGVNVYSCAVIDVNNDNYPDVVYNIIDEAYPDRPIRLWLNDNGNHLEEDTQGRLPLTQLAYYGGFKVFPMDLNDDDLCDLICSNLDTPQQSGRNVILYNQGAGFFSIPGINPLPNDNRWTTLYKAEDYDLDGDKDLIRTMISFDANEPSFQILNYDTGSYTVDTGALPTSSLLHNGFLIEDFDIDGYKDIFLPCVDLGEPMADKYLKNNGNGTYSEMNDVIPSIVDFTVDCAVINNGADPRKDIFLGNAGSEATGSGQNRIYLNTEGEGVEDLLPAQINLSAYPNPFRISTTIKFTHTFAAQEHIEIYNLKGQLVRTLDIKKGAGNISSVLWQGEDETGKKLTSGIYLLRLSNGENNSTHKLMLLK